jgi:hypothetical protein
MATKEEFDALQQAHDAYREANLKNQQGWDAEIQGRRDDAATHESAVAAITERFTAEIEALKTSHAASSQSLTERFMAEIESLKAFYATAMQTQAESLANQHAAEIAQLKASVLIPAMKDMQSRQAADLATKHAAELANLQG